MPKREPLYPHIPKSKQEDSSAIELSAAFSSLKSIRDEVDKLRVAAYMLNYRIIRILEIVEPYAKYNEYAFIKDLNKSLPEVAGDCTRAIVALDNLIKRGLI